MEKRKVGAEGDEKIKRRKKLRGETESIKKWEGAK